MNNSNQQAGSSNMDDPHTFNNEPLSNAERKLLLLSDSVQTFVRLLRMELQRSIQLVPTALTLLLLRLPLLILLWLSVSVFASYGAYMINDQVWSGLLCFMLLQFLATLKLQHSYHKAINEMSLQETRKNLHLYFTALTGNAGDQTGGGDHEA